MCVMLPLKRRLQVEMYIAEVPKTVIDCTVRPNYSKKSFWVKLEYILPFVFICPLT